MPLRKTNVRHWRHRSSNSAAIWLRRRHAKVIDPKAASKSLVSDSFRFGWPGFLARRHQGLVFEFDYGSDTERNDSLRAPNGPFAHFESSATLYRGITSALHSTSTLRKEV